jgi:hypothetical protein
MASTLSSRWIVTTVDAPVFGPEVSSAKLAPPSGGLQPQVEAGGAASGQVPPTSGKQPASPLSEAAAAVPTAPVRISRRVSRRVIPGLAAMCFLPPAKTKIGKADED